MKVTLLASTQLVADADGRPMVDWLAFDNDVQGPDALAEFAGRSCFLSWNRPNPKTAANADYIGHIIEVGHESVLSHASATFYIEGVSRSLTHELVRHRWLSFSERSLRYVDASDFRPVYPPAADEVERAVIRGSFDRDIQAYQSAVERYLERGETRKRAREAARAHLPLCTETAIVCSGNFRAMRDLLRQRLAPGADREIRQLAEALRDELVQLAPATFADAGEWSS